MTVGAALEDLIHFRNCQGTAQAGPAGCPAHQCLATGSRGLLRRPTAARKTVKGLWQTLKNLQGREQVFTGLELVGLMQICCWL